MNKDKVKNIIIIVESAVLGLFATLLIAGSISSCSSKESTLNKSSHVINRKSDFKYLSDEDAYNTYFSPLLATPDDGNAEYVLRGKGVTNVWDSNLDFSFSSSDVQFGYYASIDATSKSYVRKNSSFRIYYHDVSYTYGIVTCEFGDGSSYDSYLPNLADSTRLNYVPQLQFYSYPTPTDYSSFNLYFYTYFSARSNVYYSQTQRVKPWVKVPWLNLYPSTSEAFIVGYQSDNSYLRVVANLSNLTCWGYSSNYYESSSDPIFLGDLYFDYDGDLCLIPQSTQWRIYYSSSKYFAKWFKDNTFTSSEWSSGLMYLNEDMNIYTKYLYEDISNSSASSGEVMSLDNLRFRIYRKNLLSMSTLIDKFGINVTTLSSGDKKYTLNAWGDGSRISWADNTDSGEYVISYDDGSTSLNFKYGLSNRIHWDDAVISCQDSYSVARYFAPYYATALVDDEVTTDGSSLTNSSFNNVFLLLGNAFTLCFGWLNVEVFPGITLFGLLLVPFVVLLIIVVFRLVKK